MLQSYISGMVDLLLSCHSKPCGCNQGWNDILNWTVLLSHLSSHYFCTCTPPDEWVGWISIRSDGPGPRWQIRLKFGMPITCQRTPMIQGTIQVTHRKHPTPDPGHIYVRPEPHTTCFKAVRLRSNRTISIMWIVGLAQFLVRESFKVSSAWVQVAVLRKPSKRSTILCFSFEQAPKGY